MVGKKILNRDIFFDIKTVIIVIIYQIEIYYLLEKFENYQTIVIWSIMCIRDNFED